MNLKKLNPREKILAAAIACLIAVGGVYFLAYEPLNKKLEGLNEDIQEKELILRKGTALIKKKDKLEAEYKSMQGFLIAQGSEEELVASFLKEVGSIVRKTNVSLIDLKPQAKTAKAADYKKYLIDLSVEGNIEQVTNFIYGLETSAYLLRVERLSLSPKSEDSPVLKAEMLVSGIIVSKD